MPLITLPIFIVSLFCSWFQCEMGPEPPYLYVNVENERKLFSTISGFSEAALDGRSENYDVRGPMAYTTLGPVEGYMGKSGERDVYMFTGVPYGEPPTGHLRFRDPIPKKPWRDIWKATGESPYCIQVSGATMGMLRGQEDCLYLDVHTPYLPKSGEKKGPGLPVIIWIPAGTNMYGRSMTYGSDYMLQEDVIFVPLNVRMGVFGYLASGDEASPGNWGLKDQALAVQWVHDNIAAFGGDPNRIIIGGMSSGSAAAHSMLFTKLEARNHIKGVIGMSGSVFSNHDLDGRGRVLESSNIVAREAGCPTVAEGRTWEMVECLRKKEPYMLAAHQFAVFRDMPHMTNMWGPTIEPKGPNAYITELPEAMYEKGEVSPVPLILTRAEDETGFFQKRTRFSLLPMYILNWYPWMSTFFKLAYRTTKLGEVVPPEESMNSMLKLNRFYFGKDGPPHILSKKDFLNFVNMGNDGMYNVPCWKALEAHSKIAPTYSYVNRQQTFTLNPFVKAFEQFTNDHSGASHVSDYFLVFNNSRMVPPLKPGTDFHQASKNLLNMFANFATHGKPLYRDSTGELLPLWEPTGGDLDQMMVLDVGLVKNISMIRDPLPATMRRKIWEQVKF